MSLGLCIVLVLCRISMIYKEIERLHKNDEKVRKKELMRKSRAANVGAYGL